MQIYMINLSCTVLLSGRKYMQRSLIVRLKGNTSALARGLFKRYARKLRPAPKPSEHIINFFTRGGMMSEKMKVHE